MSMQGRVMTDDRGKSVRTSHSATAYPYYVRTRMYIHMVTRAILLKLSAKTYRFSMIVQLVT